MTELDTQELTYLANKARLPEKLVLDVAKQTVSGFLDVWAKEKNHLLLDRETINVVGTHIGKLHSYEKAEVIYDKDLLIPGAIHSALIGWTYSTLRTNYIEQ